MTDINNNFQYIILYIDENNKELEEEIYNKYNTEKIKIIKFLLPHENKSNKLEIYIDNYIEEYLLEDTLCVFFFSKIKRSDNLINLLEKYKKNVFFENNIIINPNFQNDNLDYFINHYNNLYSINKNMHKKNIKLKIEKIPNKEPMDISSDSDSDDENNINIITYYKHSTIDILNIIQKKCIYENLKNRNIKKMIVIGNNLQFYFNDMINLINKEILILHDITHSNVSFKDLFEISSNYFSKNKLVCILRSDIVLPNQNELSNLNIDNKSIISLSRIERLINGQLIKYDKLNKNLNCTEQDGWIFKSPLSIDLNLLNNIIFYEKYSELYLNNILKNSNYILINDSKKYKIIRILYENNLESRPLLENNINLQESFDSIFLLPDNESLEKISIDDILKNSNIDEKNLYLIKCDFFNKFYKNKIML